MERWAQGVRVGVAGGGPLPRLVANLVEDVVARTGIGAARLTVRDRPDRTR